MLQQTVFSQVAVAWRPTAYSSHSQYLKQTIVIYIPTFCRHPHSITNLYLSPVTFLLFPFPQLSRIPQWMNLMMSCLPNFSMSWLKKRIFGVMTYSQIKLRKSLQTVSATISPKALVSITRPNSSNKLSNVAGLRVPTQTAPEFLSYNLPLMQMSGRMHLASILTPMRLSQPSDLAGTWTFRNHLNQRMLGGITVQQCNSPNTFGTTSARNSRMGPWSVLLSGLSSRFHSSGVLSGLSIRNCRNGDEQSPTAVKFRAGLIRSSIPDFIAVSPGNSLCRIQCPSSKPFSAREHCSLSSRSLSGNLIWPAGIGGCFWTRL